MVVETEKTQGSKAWLEWRNKGLGSSDSAVLLGWSPWKSIDELLLEKLGRLKPEFSERQTAAMDRGKRLEPEIRRWYEAKAGALFPDDTGEHAAHPFMRASFDGINRELGRIIEIKAPNKLDHESAKNRVVPKKYIPQCQWLMLVSGLKRCDYVSYGSDETHVVVRVDSDLKIQKELEQRAVLFWDIVCSKGQIYGETFTRWDQTT